MTTTTILPDRLAALDTLDLQNGSHSKAEFGRQMCVMEAAAWISGEGHTDQPQCVSPVLTAYMIRLNDRWDHDKRQTLKPYIPRLIGIAAIAHHPAEKSACRHIRAAKLAVAPAAFDFFVFHRYYSCVGVCFTPLPIAGG